MDVSRRTLLIAGGAGLGAAVVSVLGGTWLEAALDDEPPIDGEVCSTSPGSTSNPSTT